MSQKEVSFLSLHDSVDPNTFKYLKMSLKKGGNEKNLCHNAIIKVISLIQDISGFLEKALDLTGYC